MRGTFIKAIGLMLLVVSTVTAQSPANPKIWLDMDQAALDAAYDQRVWAPNAAELLARYKTSSAATLSRMKPLRKAYGESEIEKLDLYTSEKPAAPIHIFIHGGAWRGGTAQDYAFVAEMLVKAGAHVVVPDFAAVQNLEGSLLPMADQVRRVIAWVYQHAGEFGGDKNRIYISGHSSGGHLAAVALTTDWSAYSCPSDIIKGGVICSGIFDLKPVRLSARREYIRFTDEMEDSLSPQRHLDLLIAPVVIVYGTKESPEFMRQSRDFLAAAKRAKKKAKEIVAEGYNHFEILETMADPDGVLGKAIVKQMGLKGTE